MKICYINPTNNIRRPIAELANILAKEGHEISVMFPVSKECPTKNWVANDAIKNGKINLIPIKSWYFAPLRYNVPNILQLIKETRKIYRTHNNIHIWEYYYLISVIPLLYSSLRKKRKEKTIITTDGFVGYPYRPKEPRWLTPAFMVYTHLFAKILFKIPNFVTIYGNAMIQPAIKLGIKKNKLKVIPTGIHLEKFKNVNQNKVSALKKEFDITTEKIILYVGMLTERKRIDRVIKVSQDLLKEGLNVKTLLVGDSHGENIYKKLVKPEYKNKIIFAGGRTEIPELMQLADVLVLLSEEEGLPGVVMESMASSLPVVCTNVGCVSDLIENGKEGTLINFNDYKKSLASIKKNLTNSIYRKKIKINCFNKIKKFEWIKVARLYYNTYLNN